MPATIREVGMLDVLVASRAPHLLRPRWFSGSAVIHLLILAVAFQASRVEVRDTRPVLADTTLLFLPRLTPPTVRPVAAPRDAGSIGGGQGAGALVISANPPPRGFQTVVAPRDIPSGIPPVDLAQPRLDPRDYVGKGVEGGVAWGVAGGTGPVDQALLAPELAEGEAVYAATLDDARFEAAQLISQPLPRYPRALEIIGVSGRVMMQFIVDTTGRVERRSLQVLESTHREFEEPARQSVAEALFLPAKLGRTPVRQLTRQPISFVASR